jgi:GT2 family glycosyltransferase
MRIGMCICTIDRPVELRRCLQSIAQADVMPDEVIVSDDSANGKATMEVCKEFSFVRYIRGPQRGIPPNRNFAIRACSADYIALPDDDSLVSADFVNVAKTLASRSEGHTIFTGKVLENNGETVIELRNPTFWGHFERKPQGRQLETVHISCCLFPRSAFRVAEFDERIAFGYDDMDLCAHLLTLGYRIEYHPDLVVQHLPPPISEERQKKREEQGQQARFYTSLKRYYLWQRKPLKAIVYVPLAVAHQMASCIKERKYAGAVRVIPNMAAALRLLSSGEVESREDTVG